MDNAIAATGSSFPEKPRTLTELLNAAQPEQPKRKDEQMKLPNVFEKQTPPVTYAAGSIIYKEGQTRDSMYIVKKGAVDLLVRGERVETVAEGGFFGEIAMVDHSPRSATAVAKTDCSLIAINEKQFLFNVQEAPFFALIVMRTLTARLRKRSMVLAPATERSGLAFAGLAVAGR